MEPLQTSTPAASEPKSFGAIAGIVIVLALIIAGGLYFWMQKPESATPDQAATQTQQEELPPVSESDDVDSIESDLNATAISDEDFSSFESELNAQ